MKLATSYFGCRIPRHVKRDMLRLRRWGFTRVIHTFSENDLFYYPDTMAEIVAMSRAAGLEVLLDPWGVAGIFGGEAFSRWIVEEPDLVQRGPSGRPLGGACLNHPRLRERLGEWLDAAARTGAEWIFWDEPHWSPRGPRNPDGEVCACSHCRRAARGDREATPQRLRAESVVSLLAFGAGQATRRGLRSSVCVLPQGVLDQPELNWPRLSALPGVAEFGSDPYWQAFGISGTGARDAFIDQNARAACAAARAAPAASMLWLQAFRVAAADEEDLLAGASRLISHAPDTVAVWGFEACAHMSALACENPRRLWRRLLNRLRPGLSS